MYERKLRTVLRAISWRITATLTTFIISYFVTGNLDLAITIGGVELVAKLFIQYVHERLWMRIKFGFIKPEYHI